nr:uncharacterized protein LOC127347272 [Lolium perenne]
MTINDGLDSNWEYHQNNVAVGAMFPSKRHMQDAIMKWAMASQRQLRTTVSSGKYLTMECVDINCPGRVHGSAVVHSEIVEGQVMRVNAIRKNVKKHHFYTISYGKAWRAKQRAMEMRFGSFRDAYDAVVRLLQTLQARNPDTYVNIQGMFLQEYPSYRVLHRVYFSFGVCIESFRHCRPVLCVDGTFLTGQYKGQILTAIGMDGNNQIVPLAFAFVESENTESWLWFFRQLKISIVKDKPNVCILHDGHAGISKAIKTPKEPGQETPWIDIESRWCMRHLGANFYTQFRNKPLMNVFKRLCIQNQQWKYNFLRSKVQEYTAATRVRLIPPTDPAQAPPASMHDMYPTQSTAGSRQHAGQLTADLQDEVARYTRQVSSAPLLQRDQHVSWLRRLEDKLRGIYSAITCSRSSDVVRRHLLPPRPSTQQQPTATSHTDRNTRTTTS